MEVILLQLFRSIYKGFKRKWLRPRATDAASAAAAAPGAARAAADAHASTDAKPKKKKGRRWPMSLDHAPPRGAGGGGGSAKPSPNEPPDGGGGAPGAPPDGRAATPGKSVRGGRKRSKSVANGGKGEADFCMFMRCTPFYDVSNGLLMRIGRMCEERRVLEAEEAIIHQRRRIRKRVAHWSVAIRRIELLELVFRVWNGVIKMVLTNREKMIAALTKLREIKVVNNASMCLCSVLFCFALLCSVLWVRYPFAPDRQSTPYFFCLRRAAQSCRPTTGIPR